MAGMATYAALDFTWTAEIESGDMGRTLGQVTIVCVCVGHFVARLQGTNLFEQRYIGWAGSVDYSLPCVSLYGAVSFCPWCFAVLFGAASYSANTSGTFTGWGLFHRWLL